MFTRLLRLVSYIAVINAPSPPVWSLWGCVMKMLSILRKFAPNRARRRVTPSPASMIYWLPLTTSRFDDCARPTSGNGPFFVPNVMTRVLFLDDATSLFDCPQAKGDTANDAAPPAARWRNCLRGSFIAVPSWVQFGIYGISAGPLDYSGLIPANLTTLAHFSVSSEISFRKSAGEPARIEPCSTRRALMLGSARPALISRLSLSMISAGVFLGAPMPNQVLVS